MICICSLYELPRQAKALRATHVLSLLGVEGGVDTPPGVAAENHLFLPIDDIAYEAEGYRAPVKADVEQIIEFGRAWNRQGPMIVHCYAGVSRSTAAALTIMCLYNEGREMEMARVLRQLAPHAQPNQLLVDLADAALTLNGRLRAAVHAMGPGDFSVQPPPVNIAAVLPD